MQHHAYLLIGTPSECLLELDEKERKPGPDVLYFESERFGIDEARRLKHEASLRPLGAPYRTFILVISSITLEAENALLKLFEEPEETARFYVLVEKEDMLIPTLRSRLMLLSENGAKVGITKEAELFLKSSYAARLELIAERTKEKDVAWRKALIDGIEAWADKKGDREALVAVLFIRKYSDHRGASLKMLLEHLALSLSVPS